MAWVSHQSPNFLSQINTWRNTMKEQQFNREKDEAFDELKRQLAIITNQKSQMTERDYIIRFYEIRSQFNNKINEIDKTYELSLLRKTSQSNAA
tara:strand:- start:2571 stop:2852 length:282 start_codon:yes stop_codon:yes gene_type:complete